MSQQEQDDDDESFVERVDRIIDCERSILDRLADCFWYEV
jgi:hypothetical protein